MEIVLDHVSKRFLYTWIFRSIELTLNSNKSYAIKGPNGSGKSTLLKIISGQLSPSEGKVLYRDLGAVIPLSEIYKKVSFAAPYVDLIEEFSLEEALTFHQRFKKFHHELTIRDVMEESRLINHKSKKIHFFSSGMKQRLKLTLALCSDCPIILLDEPTSFLDTEGKEWFHYMLEKYKKERMIIIASNDPEDLISCHLSLDMANYQSNRNLK